MTERAKAAKIALVGVLGITLVIVLVRPSGKASSTSGQVSAQTTALQTHNAGESIKSDSGTAPAGTSSANTRWKRPDPVGPVSRDPMLVELPKDEVRPQEGPESVQDPVKAPEFRVAGIVFNTDQPSSIIIDGHILHEGETIHGATVTRITKEYGVLSHGEKSWIVQPGQSNREPE